MNIVRIARLAILVLFVSVLVENPANASTIITYTGYVGSGWDFTGVFGRANSSISGSMFTAKFIISNPSPPLSYLLLSNGSIVNPYNQPIRFRRVGSGWGEIRPYEFAAMSATLSINNNSIAYLGQRFANVDHQGPGAPYSLVSHRIEDLLTLTPVNENVNLSLSISSLSDRFTDSWDYRDPLFHQIQSGDVTTGHFQYIKTSGSNFALTALAGGSLIPTSVTIQRAIPEPSIWLALVLGFGLTGMAFRLRRRRCISLRESLNV